MTWFDLTDAFGSVPLAFITNVLSHYNLPPQIISYIQDIYTQLKGRVVTNDWEVNISSSWMISFREIPIQGSSSRFCINLSLNTIEISKTVSATTSMAPKSSATKSISTRRWSSTLRRKPQAMASVLSPASVAGMLFRHWDTIFLSTTHTKSIIGLSTIFLKFLKCYWLQSV